MHKIVNGEKVELTPEEEEAFKLEWAANEAKSKKRREEYLRKKQIKDNAREKLFNMAGLTDEEKEMLKI